MKGESRKNKKNKPKDKKQRTFSADTIAELKEIWRTQLMDNGWRVKKPLDVRWNWFKFGYEYYFVAKYIA